MKGRVEKRLWGVKRRPKGIEKNIYQQAVSRGVLYAAGRARESEPGTIGEIAYLKEFGMKKICPGPLHQFAEKLKTNSYLSREGCLIIGFLLSQIGGPTDLGGVGEREVNDGFPKGARRLRGGLGRLVSQGNPRFRLGKRGCRAYLRECRPKRDFVQIRGGWKKYPGLWC